MELRKEARDLLFCMLRKGDWITGEELSRMLGWNKKKVQQNIKWLMEDIGQEGNIETQKNKGYRVCRISECLRNEILKDAFYNEVYFNLDERRIILIMDLLFRRQYIPMDQLAEDYYLSKSVVFEEIRQMRRWFGRNDDIQLEVSPQRGIYIHGEEKDKRYACTAWGPLHVLQMTKIDPDAVQHYQESMEQAAEPLQQLLIDTGRFISGEEYSFLLRYIAMSRLRSSLGYYLPEMGEKPFEYTANLPDLFKQARPTVICDRIFARELSAAFQVPEACIRPIVPGLTYHFDDFTLNTFSGNHTDLGTVSNFDGGKMFADPENPMIGPLNSYGCLYNTNYAFTLKNGFFIGFAAGVDLTDLQAAWKNRRPGLLLRQRIATASAESYAEECASLGAQLVLPMHQDASCAENSDMNLFAQKVNGRFVQKNCTARMFNPQRLKWYSLESRICLDEN